MKKLLFIAFASTLLLFACNRTNSRDDFDIETITVEDSVHFPPEAMEEWMFDDQASYLTVVDAPVTKNEDLRDNIIAWISTFLSPNYTGDSQDVQAMVEYDRDEFLGPITGSPQSRQEYFITVQEENDRYVTYLCDSYLYTGGAHGTSAREGATFLKKTGERFTYEMFNTPENLIDLIKAGLEAQYFYDVLDGTDLGFEDAIMQEALDDFPMPMTEPWIQNDSIFFVYMTYEISAYSLGMPQCGFPYQKLKPFLKEEAMAFFETPSETSKK